MVEFQNKCGILGQLWINYKDDKDLRDFKDFVEYNDIGLPLAYMVAEGLVKEITDLGIEYIDETFNMFIAGLELEEDEIEYDWDLTDLLSYVSEKRKKE